MKTKETLKEKIMRLATAEFVKYGYSRVTTNNLANAIGISKRTLYEYFPSKEQLFREIIEKKIADQKKQIEQIMEKIISDPDSDFVTEIHNLWMTINEDNSNYHPDMLDDVQRHLPKVWERILKYREETMKKYFFKIHEIGRAKGIYRDNVNLDLIYFMVFNMTSMLFKNEMAHDLPLTKREIIKSMASVFFTGILTEKGKQEYQDKLKYCPNHEDGINNIDNKLLK